MSTHAQMPGDQPAPRDSADRSVVDLQLDDPGSCTEIDIQDRSVEVIRYSGVVRCGIGARAWIHPGNVVDATDGAIIYLAPGADLDEPREAELARGEITVCPWSTYPQIDIGASS